MLKSTSVPPFEERVMRKLIKSGLRRLAGGAEETQRREPAYPRHQTGDKDAFIIMNLSFDADWKTIQKRFKTLVKKFHPDKNAGNKQYEDKLKKITLAYSHLKKIILEKN